MKHSRNRDKHTDASAARKNILRLLDAHPSELFNKSSLGYAAFPGYDFKRPQGAAFSVAKIVRDMEKEGVIGYQSNGVSWGHRITGHGRMLHMMECLA